MIIDLDSWEAGYDDGHVAARPNALPVSMNSHMRAATAKLTPLVEERWKPCATVDRQPRGPFSGALAAHG
jgi:hypothetical protein